MKKIILKAIRSYQQTSFLHRPFFQALFLSDKVCRFRPTCSQYTYQAVEKYGVLQGGWFGLRRILHCHPWSRGGADPLK